MFSQVKASIADACPWRDRAGRPRVAPWLALAAALSHGGCQPTTVARLATDPADPAAEMAPLHVPAVTSPYASQRPVSPTSWRQRNDAVAPRSEPER